VSDDRVMVSEVAEGGRFEAHVGDEPAGLITYRIAGGRMVLPHTEVEPRFEGRGVGSRLAVAALDAARARGLSVVPACPFVRAYIDRHPEYGDLVG
jgi:predicted GNAT family acetyltransferase